MEQAGPRPGLGLALALSMAPPLLPSPGSESWVLLSSPITLARGAQAAEGGHRLARGETRECPGILGACGRVQRQHPRRGVGEEAAAA